VVHNSCKLFERILILFSLVFFVYPVSAFLSHPNWRAAIHDTFVPSVIRSSDYLIMVVGLIGTTITPWMRFDLQASVVEKGIGKRQTRSPNGMSFPGPS
jgi:Mn2+/Fe2+ NRAMP family transporter